MMDRFAATLLAMLVAAPASAQMMVDGGDVRQSRRGAYGSVRRLHRRHCRCTRAAARVLHSAGHAARDHRTHRRFLARWRAPKLAATPASSRSSSRLRPSGDVPLRGPAWASPSIRPQGRASISASTLTGAPSPKSGDAYRCRPLGRPAADQHMRFASSRTRDCRRGGQSPTSESKHT
jgi:hypothetical protein